MQRLDPDLALRGDDRDRRRVFVRAHGVAVARLNFGVRVGHDDVLYIVDAHVLHRDGELDLVAKVVVALDVLVLGLLVRDDLVAGNRQRGGHKRQSVVVRHVRVVVVPVADDDARRARLHGRFQLFFVHAHIRLAAGDVQRGFVHIVAVHQTRGGIARADLDLVRGVQLRAVRAAVVSHGVIRGGDLDLLLARAALGDRQRTGDEGDGLILTLRVLASGVYDG